MRNDNMVGLSRQRQIRKRRTGAAAVEFAMVAPVFLLLLGGIIEFGQAFRIQHALSTAARRGARSAVLSGSNCTTITDKVKNQCVTVLGVKGSDVTVAIQRNGQPCTDLNGAAAGDEITVTASIPFSTAGAGFYSNTFSKSVLKGSCVLEHE
jgi:Flp pilus assembly protein TadG